MRELCKITYPRSKTTAPLAEICNAEFPFAKRAATRYADILQNMMKDADEYVIYARQ